jgi:hypothetical protein
MNEDKTNQYKETDEQYAWRLNLAKVLAATPRDTPIQFKLQDGDPWADRSIFSAKDAPGTTFYSDIEYRVKPAPRLRVRKLSEIIAEAEKVGEIKVTGSGELYVQITATAKQFYLSSVVNNVGQDKKDVPGFPSFCYEEIPENE